MTNQERDHKKRKKLSVLSKNTFSLFFCKRSCIFSFYTGLYKLHSQSWLKKKKKTFQCLLQQHVAMWLTVSRFLQQLQRTILGGGGHEPLPFSFDPFPTWNVDVTILDPWVWWSSELEGARIPEGFVKKKHLMSQDWIAKLLQCVEWISWNDSCDSICLY